MAHPDGQLGCLCGFNAGECESVKSTMLPKE